MPELNPRMNEPLTLLDAACAALASMGDLGENDYRQLMVFLIERGEIPGTHWVQPCPDPALLHNMMTQEQCLFDLMNQLHRALISAESEL